MNEPWKVRGIMLLGLLVLAVTLFATEGWQVAALVVVAVVLFGWGLKVAAADPYDLQELGLLQAKHSDLDVENKAAICPHCGEEYPGKRSVCPHCLRSP